MFLCSNIIFNCISHITWKYFPLISLHMHSSRSPKPVRPGASINDVNDVTWLNDVINVTSQSPRSSHSESKTQTIYPCGQFKYTLKNIMLNREYIRTRTAGEGAFHKTALRSKFGTFSRQRLSVWKVKPPLTIRVDLLSIHYHRTLGQRIYSLGLELWEKYLA